MVLYGECCRAFCCSPSLLGKKSCRVRLRGYCPTRNVCSSSCESSQIRPRHVVSSSLCNGRRPSGPAQCTDDDQPPQSTKRTKVRTLSPSSNRTLQGPVQRKTNLLSPAPYQHRISSAHHLKRYSIKSSRRKSRPA